MSQGTVLSTSVSDDTRERVDRYQQRRGFDSRSEALAELAKVGLREQRRPMLYRLKDHVIEWASQLVIAGVIVWLAASLTGVVAHQDGFVLALVLFGVAAAMLAGYELVRVVAGTNALGAAGRRLLGTVTPEVDDE